MYPQDNGMVIQTRLQKTQETLHDLYSDSLIDETLLLELLSKLGGTE